MSAMTEAEAKTKWCPFGRVLITSTLSSPASGPVHVALAAPNRGTASDGKGTDTLCFGSACMAWRWDDPVREINNDRRRGFCGLAASARP